VIKVNLLREHVVEAPPKIKIRPQVNRIGLLLLALLLAVGVGLVWSWWHLDQQRTLKLKDLEAQRGEIQRLEKIKNTAADFEKQKQALQNRINVIEQLRRNQTGPVELLNNIIEAIPAQPILWLELMTQKGNAIHVEGYSFAVESISDFIAALNRTGYFANVDLEYFSEEARAVKFSINCVVGQKKKAA
jgi:Tfp pilus assembly protein PilN